MAFNSCRALNVIHQTTSYMTERNSSDRDPGVGANNSNSQAQRQQEPGYRDKCRSSSVVENWDLHPSEEQQNSRPEPPLSKESWVRAQVLVFSHLREINSFHPPHPQKFTSLYPTLSTKFSTLISLDFRDARLPLPFSFHWQLPALSNFPSLPTSLWATRSQGSPLSLHDDPLLSQVNLVQLNHLNTIHS